MIEIVFGESACGSLKIAQTYGKGKYRGSAVSVFMRHEDGSVPSSDEMKEAQIQAQEQEHIAWENIRKKRLRIQFMRNLREHKHLTIRKTKKGRPYEINRKICP